MKLEYQYFPCRIHLKSCMHKVLCIRRNTIHGSNFYQHLLAPTSTVAWVTLELPFFACFFCPKTVNSSRTEALLQHTEHRIHLKKRRFFFNRFLPLGMLRRHHRQHKFGHLISPKQGDITNEKSCCFSIVEVKATDQVSSPVSVSICQLCFIIE